MDKIDKMVPVEMSWFDMLIEMRFKLESRIFSLEQRVKDLEGK